MSRRRATKTAAVTPCAPTPNGFEGEIEGPEDTFIEDGTTLRIPFQLQRRNGHYELRVQEHRSALEPGVYTEWLRLTFRTAIGAKAIGIARFLLTETEPECSLYVSPINIDPEQPALPISHPSYYAVYLANLLGSYATAGMAEDTWALNEGVIDEDAFLRQAYSIYDEREAMFLNALESTSRGVVACVFDTSDRIQHMFYAHAGASDRHSKVIEEMYQRMDALVGKTLPFVDKDTALFVLSDHGFCSFRRGVNLNAWLRDNGYLHLKNDARESGSFLEGVDWSRTRAYALGLAGFYLNIKGREALGIVEPGQEAERLKQEIIAKLSALARGHGRDADPHGLRHCVALSRALSGCRAGPHRRIQRRLSRLLGWRGRQGLRATFSKTTRRPGAATTASIPCWFPASSFRIARSRPRIPASKTWPRRHCACSASIHPRGWTGSRCYEASPERSSPFACRSRAAPATLRR